METMTEALLADSAIDAHSFFPGLSAVAQLCAKPSNEFWNEFRESRGFTELHEVLLGIRHDAGTLCDYLTRLSEERTISDLIDLRDAHGRSALSWAVEYGWVDAVVTLIKFGADVNQQRVSNNGKLPMLHLALAGPNSVERGTAFLQVAQQLLLAGDDVNAVDNEGWTALHIAASWNDYKAVRTLLDFAGQRLRWSAVTTSYEFASQLAANDGGDRALVELLLSHEFSEHLGNFELLPS